ncbi:MAG: signal recognition particle-docking protein FtsY [Roseinatronobacter sp.]
MSFFSKLKERMLRSSSKLDEGLEALVDERTGKGASDPQPDTGRDEAPDEAPDAGQGSQPEPSAPEPSASGPAPSRPAAPAAATPGPASPAAGAHSSAPTGPGLLGRMLGREDAPRRVLDDEMLESLEDLLIQADMGVETAMRVSANLAEGRFGRKLTVAEIKTALAAEIARIMEPVARPLPLYGARPQVVLVVGVNGAGKTTTIGKLASQLRAAGKSVMIAAGDTFRAAAVEQLQVWGSRAGVPVMTAPEGSDPASLAHDALMRARREGVDLLMIDTAGRLQNRTDLMEELAKILRVLRRIDPDAPHNTLLVLDATTGQNALNQVEIFQKLADVSGLVMTKLDGTARGGVLVALADRFGLPIHAIGVGEQIDDLQAFDPEDFAAALVGIDPAA